MVHSAFSGASGTARHTAVPEEVMDKVEEQARKYRGDAGFARLRHRF
jgi:hypothetical protein